MAKTWAARRCSSARSTRAVAHAPRGAATLQALIPRQHVPLAIFLGAGVLQLVLIGGIVDLIRWRSRIPPQDRATRRPAARPVPGPRTPEEELAHHIAILMFHDTGHPGFAANAKRYAELWETLVPDAGEAASVQGEILRAVGRLATEDRRNGSINWGEYYEQLVEFLRLTLVDPSVFTSPQRERMLDDLGKVIANGLDSLDHDEMRVVFGRLIEDAVAWCAARPRLIAKPSAG